MEYCYMCDNPATSREHVPPRCLFPESKDVGGESHRRNLITVPSCDLHNAAKSRDDEFLMVSLAGIIGNNSIGHRHKFGKVNKAIRRSADRLLETVFTQKKQIFLVEVAPNKFFDVIWGTPDAERLKRCFDHIVRALHVHHFGVRFSGTVKPYLGYLWTEDKNAKAFNEFVKQKFEIELEGKERLGENQQVFFYQVTDKDQFGLYALRLCFYGGLNIYAALIPENVKVPENVAWALMNRGIKTIVTLGDKSFEFN